MLKLVRSLSAGGLDGDMCVRVLQFSLDVFETIVSAYITSSRFFIAEQCGIVFLSLFFILFTNIGFLIWGNKIAVNILLCPFVATCFHFSRIKISVAFL